MNKAPLLVIGAGAWGTALAIVLARNQHPVYLWGRNTSHIDQLKKQGKNLRYLPEAVFPDCLIPTHDLQYCLGQSEGLVLAVPCAAILDILGLIAGFAEKANLKICVTSKGLHNQMFSHQLVAEHLGSGTDVVALSGPSFAGEVAAGLPTAVTIAGPKKITSWFAQRFHDSTFRTYIHHDLIGVQTSGAIKNVMAIAAGIADGLGFGANTQAALITRGLAEITRLGLALGGHRETFTGLSGLGDLVLTCTHNQSRNRRFGLEIAKGIDAQAAHKNIEATVEGLNTTEAIHHLAATYQIEMPITEQVYQVINGNTTPRNAVKALLARALRPELDEI